MSETKNLEISPLLVDCFKPGPIQVAVMLLAMVRVFLKKILSSDNVSRFDDLSKSEAVMGCYWPLEFGEKTVVIDQFLVVRLGCPVPAYKIVLF